MNITKRMALGVGLAINEFYLVRNISWFYFSGISCILELFDLAMIEVVLAIWLIWGDWMLAILWRHCVALWTFSPFNCRFEVVYFFFFLMDVWNVWITCMFSFSLYDSGLVSMCKSFDLCFACSWSNKAMPAKYIFKLEMRMAPSLWLFCWYFS